MSLGQALSKTWFGFDLDDTLHEFRRASANASTHVFEAIHSSNTQISIDTLRATYTELLRNTTANAFTDGRTSAEYRRERFGRLLQVHGLMGLNHFLGPGNPLLDRLLDLYSDSLRQSLALKSGVLYLLQTLRQSGKKILVITEGPADAQEWTVRELGIWRYIDVLVTTNELGISKVDGLFGVVLEKYGISSDDIVYFGDNEVRDVLAARKEGIVAVHYDEKQESRLDDIDALRVNSWAVVETVLVHGE
jgi:putative hydrolase of the HAD superfamily